MVKFAVEFWWNMLLTIFPSKRSSKISFQTSPEVHHQFCWKPRQLHSGNCWGLEMLLNFTFLFHFYERFQIARFERWRFRFARSVIRTVRFETFDEGQITHLICARLKYDLYDFLGGVLGLLPVLFLVEKAQKHPLKSHIDHISGGHRLDE